MSQTTPDLELDLYAAGLVHHPEELELQDERGVGIAARAGPMSPSPA